MNLFIYRYIYDGVNIFEQFEWTDSMKRFVGSVFIMIVSKVRAQDCDECNSDASRYYPWGVSSSYVNGARPFDPENVKICDVCDQGQICTATNILPPLASKCSCYLSEGCSGTHVCKVGAFMHTNECVPFSDDIPFITPYVPTASPTTGSPTAPPTAPTVPPPPPPPPPPPHTPFFETGGGFIVIGLVAVVGVITILRAAYYITLKFGTNTETVAEWIRKVSLVFESPFRAVVLGFASLAYDPTSELAKQIMFSGAPHIESPVLGKSYGEGGEIQIVKNVL